jgi:hypothetical protein
MNKRFFVNSPAEESKIYMKELTISDMFEIRGGGQTPTQPQDKWD